MILSWNIPYIYMHVSTINVEYYYYKINLNGQHLVYCKSLRSHSVMVWVLTPEPCSLDTFHEGRLKLLI